MKFDPNFVDFEKSDSAIGIVLNPNGAVGGSGAEWGSVPVPFMGIDGGSYVLMPDGKVYPND